MPKAEITIRFKPNEVLARNSFSSVKKSEREEIKKRYPGAKILSQKVITDGIPDRIGLGELRANGQVAIRTEFTISDEQAKEFK